MREVIGVPASACWLSPNPDAIFEVIWNLMKRFVAVLFTSVCCLSGCAEGPMHRLGHLNPWVVDQWEKEDRYAMTLYTKRSNIRDLAKLAQAKDPQVAQEAVSALNQILANEDLPLAKIEAARALGTARPRQAVEGLLGALDEPEAEVRIAVCDSLGKQGSPQSIAALEGVINSDTENDVRLAAARALGNIDDPNAARALAGALSDRSPALQFRSMESLKQITGEDFNGDTERWRSYVQGDFQVDRDPPSLADRIGGMFR
jgi:hypothetical protein